MRETIKPAFVLLAITFAVTLAVSLVNSYTKDIIEERLYLESMRNRALVLAEATNMKDITDEALALLNGDDSNVVDVFEGYRGDELIGYVFDIEVRGYNPGMQVTVGIKSSGEIEKVLVGKNSETPGLGSRAAEPPFISQFEGKNIDDGEFKLVTNPPSAPNEIEAISGATMSSRGVHRGVQGAASLLQILFKQ